MFACVFVSLFVCSHVCPLVRLCVGMFVSVRVPLLEYLPVCLYCLLLYVSVSRFVC